MKYILTSNKLTVVDSNGTSHVFDSNDKVFEKVCGAVSQNNEELFFEVKKAEEFPSMEDFSHELFEKREDGIFYRGIWKLEGATLQKLESMVKYNFDLNPLILFLDNLFNNVSQKVITELIHFLDYEELPITDDGCFIAYKGLRADKYSCTGNVDVKPIQGVMNERGHILNEEGHVIEVIRNQVDDERGVGCSTGLHAGSYKYAKDFAQGILATVKINPKDVVSVPQDCNNQKLRCCKYVVVKHEVFKIEIPVSDGVEGSEEKLPEVTALDKIKDFFDQDYIEGAYYYDDLARELFVPRLILQKYVEGKNYDIVGNRYIVFCEDCGVFRINPC